jgi:hypothetical protein
MKLTENLHEKNEFVIGQEIEILDISNQVYCPGIIKESKANKKLLIHYLGWEDSWDESLDRNGKRIHLNSFTSPLPFAHRCTSTADEPSRNQM